MVPLRKPHGSPQDWIRPLGFRKRSARPRCQENAGCWRRDPTLTGGKLAEEPSAGGGLHGRGGRHWECVGGLEGGEGWRKKGPKASPASSQESRKWPILLAMACWCVGSIYRSKCWQWGRGQAGRRATPHPRRELIQSPRPSFVLPPSPLCRTWSALPKQSKIANQRDSPPRSKRACAPNRRELRSAHGDAERGVAPDDPGEGTRPRHAPHSVHCRAVHSRGPLSFLGI